MIIDIMKLLVLFLLINLEGELSDLFDSDIISLIDCLVFLISGFRIGISSLLAITLGPINGVTKGFLKLDFKSIIGRLGNTKGLGAAGIKLEFVDNLLLEIELFDGKEAGLELLIIFEFKLDLLINSTISTITLQFKSIINNKINTIEIL